MAKAFVLTKDMVRGYDYMKIKVLSKQLLIVGEKRAKRIY